MSVKIDQLVKNIRKQLAFTDDLDNAVRLVRNDLEGIVPDSTLQLLPVAQQKLLDDMGLIKTPNSLHAEQRGVWYTGPSGDGIWSKLKAYYLSPTGKGWPGTDVESIDESSSEVVSLLDPPQRDSFSTRGLVVGYVQSGKTANMSAVIAKAIDAGFRMVIILAGTTNKLREQTQKRLVGDIVELDPDAWQLFTDPDSDYYPGSSSSLEPCSSSGGPARLFVIKKNARVLERVLAVLETSGKERLISCPTLIIDDESDQASVNTAAGADDVAPTNALIRGILKKLPKVSYVGYTATPYANVLINPERNAKGDISDDLYPAHFITALPRPESYFGAEKLFGRNFIDGEDDAEDGLDMVRAIPDSEVPDIRPPSKGVEDFIPQITPTLEAALRWFIIATAAKADPDSHSTMLIHVTHLVEAHEKLAGVVSTRVAQLQKLLRRGDARLLAELKEQWEEEYPRVDHAHFGNEPRKWDHFSGSLSAVAERIETVVENSASDNRVDYDDDPRTYIAIGGHVLARGLTMEGLISSYFLRTSKQYDTLMQMGRWFGYRRGYEELPRLWAAEDVLSSFRELATVEAEIRQDIALYREHKVSPLEFAVRIREVPGMMVTARNKMTAAIRTNLSFDGRHLQLLRYSENDRDWLDNNWQAGFALVEDISGQGGTWQQGHTGRYAAGISHNLIISFLNHYQKHPEQGSIDLEAIRHYIADAESCNGNVWSVGVVEPQRKGTESAQSLGSGVGHVRMVNRAPLKMPRDMADIKALMSRQDLLIDLPAVVFDGQSWDEVKAVRQKEGARPLLLLYAIDRNSTSNSDNRRKMDAVLDPLGFGICFPGEAYRPKSYVQVDLSAFTEAEPEDQN